MAKDICGVQHYTLNVRSRGKQLVLFSRESFLMFPETKSRETSGLESENWQCFSRLLSRHFPPLFDPANGSSCLVERKSRNIRICYLYGFIESYSHHSSNHRYEYYKNKNGTKSVPCIWILQFMSRRSNSIN